MRAKYPAGVPATPPARSRSDGHGFSIALASSDHRTAGVFSFPPPQAERKRDSIRAPENRVMEPANLRQERLSCHPRERASAIPHPFTLSEPAERASRRASGLVAYALRLGPAGLAQGERMRAH